MKSAANKKLQQELKCYKKTNKEWIKCFKFYNKGQEEKADDSYRKAYSLLQDFRTMIYTEPQLRKMASVRELYKKILIEIDRVDFLSSHNIAYKAQAAVVQSLNDIKDFYFDVMEILLGA